MPDDATPPDDEKLLALGRAVFAFQQLEWVAIWTVCFLIGQWPPEVDPVSFGQIVKRMKSAIEAARWLPEIERSSLAQWAESLDEINQLRQDVFHWHPGGAERDEFVRRRPKTDERITIDAERLDAARKRFDHARLVGEAAHNAAWPPVTRESMERDLRDRLGRAQSDG